LEPDHDCDAERELIVFLPPNAPPKVGTPFILELLPLCNSELFLL